MLMVADGRVASVGHSLDVPDGALAIDATCVVPGVINAHVHLELDAAADAVGQLARTTPTQLAIRAAGQAHRTVCSG